MTETASAYYRLNPKAKERRAKGAKGDKSAPG
jgi:hypothetical protein